jgi:hypothetical protein
MNKKSMTIPEFLEMTRVKEFNKKRRNKINKEAYVLIALLAILSVLTYYSIDLSHNTVTAFLWSELQC